MSFPQPVVVFPDFDDRIDPIDLVWQADLLNSNVERNPFGGNGSAAGFDANIRLISNNLCASALDLNNLDQERKKMEEAYLEGNRRTEKRFARGLEDVSHLFLSQSHDRPEKAETPDITSAQAPSERAKSCAPFLLHDSLAVSRESILGFLNGSAAALEEGLRSIDANIPCHPFGLIDLLAVDSQDQLCIINIDVVQKEESLLRGIACFDWIVRNTPIVRRMYQGRVINFSAQPRLFLVAPGFSSLVKCVAERITSPKVCCFAYRTVAIPAGVGILFEHA